MKVYGEGICGQTQAGKPVERYMLECGALRAAVLTYGGTLQSLWVPDKNGNPVDIVLGCPTVAGYEQQNKFLGALIGRYANRIGGGKFTLNGETYTLFCNNGRNHLHGGQKGFDKRLWEPEIQADGLHLRLTSCDGEEGYPGNLQVEVVYALTEDAFKLEYWAQTDADTLCNLTNHSYFNLAGHNSGTVLQQEIRLDADCYTPADAESIPHGEIAPVEGTPMDLRDWTPIGAHIDEAFDQLQFAGGYDHNWVVRGTPGTLRRAAQARCAQTGITLEAQTTQPGLQFYAGNSLDGSCQGKDGAGYPRRSGFCLETQAFPNSINCPDYPQAILRAGEMYHHTTVYRFGVEKE